MAIYAAPDLPHCNRALGQAINDDGVPQHALIIFAKSWGDSLSLTPVLLTSPLVQESRRATAREPIKPIHISDFRNPRTSSIAKRSRSIHSCQTLTCWPRS